MGNTGDNTGSSSTDEVPDSVPRRVGVGPRPEFTLSYYGHCAFLLKSPQGARVLTDPYRNARGFYWFTRRFPAVDCDLALVTHAHFDHDAIERLAETTSVMRTPGDFKFRDVSISGVQDWHSGQWTSEQLLAEAGRLTPQQMMDRHFGLANVPNVMFRLEIAGISLLHMGDNRANWPDDVSEAIGQVDVLMIPVDDSCHLLNHDQVARLIAQVSPKIIAPMHYRIPGLNPDSITLDEPMKWLGAQPVVKRLEGHSVIISKEVLPESAQVWFFQPASESMTAQTIGPIG